MSAVQLEPRPLDAFLGSSSVAASDGTLALNESAVYDADPKPAVKCLGSVARA